MTQLRPGNHLTPDLLALVQHVATPLGPLAPALVEQASQATVVSYSATMLDVELPADKGLVDLPDGPIPSRAFVYGAEGLTGELLVWISAGRLIGLEQAWYTDEPPLEWPHVEAVKVS